LTLTEIDRFKSLNDRFGHEKADAVLQQVADLMVAHRGSFPGKTIAYRAHGDEFFYVGRGVDSAVDEGLETLRKAIAAIKIETDVEGSDLMQCTVSIGWLSKGDLQGSMITDRVVHDALELAVANAKRSRDAVVRFSSKLKQEDWIALRADCRACGCRFAFDVMRTDAASRVGEQTWCPNCGERAERPPLPTARQPGLPHEI
jgi:diguanylate cyclase (GGDEF)-like protein